MKVTLTASTGAKILVWREQDLFSACRAGSRETPETCLPVDLFEVIADLADLDLDRPSQSVEAMRLAAEAEARLAPSSTRFLSTS